MNDINMCPRCGGFALEHLATHASCLECGYCPDIDPDLALWKRLEFPNQYPKQIHAPLHGQAIQTPDILT